jgi:hypothetical protein
LTLRLKKLKKEVILKKKRLKTPTKNFSSTVCSSVGSSTVCSSIASVGFSTACFSFASVVHLTVCSSIASVGVYTFACELASQLSISVQHVPKYTFPELSFVSCVFRSLIFVSPLMNFISCGHCASQYLIPY